MQGHPTDKQDSTTHTEHTRPPAQCPNSDMHDGHPSFSNSWDTSNPFWITDKDELPTYKRNAGRRMQGTQMPHTWGNTYGACPGRAIWQWVGLPTSNHQLYADKDPHPQTNRWTRNPDQEAPRHIMWTWAELDAWDTLDNPRNYDDLDLYYQPNEGGRDYLADY